MSETFTWRTRGGHEARFEVRPGTSDWNNVNAIAEGDEYAFAGSSWHGTALDIGAHIGEVAICLALDNPGLRVIAVEAVPDNVALLRANVARNDLSDRIEVIEAAASCSPAPVRIAYDFRAEDPAEAEVAHVHRYIGNIAFDFSPRATVIEQPSVSLGALVALHAPIALLVIDCEGCEWSFLDDPAIAHVEELRGEWHTIGANGIGRLHELLDPTHDLWHDGEGFGPFRAVRRAAQARAA